MRPILRSLLISASLFTVAATVGLTPTTALAAGPESEEIWFGTGTDSLETDESGKLTEAGAKTRAKEVDRIPGEDDWELKVHARLNGYAAEGPIYTEFYQTVQGKEYIVFRNEDSDYDGARLYTAVILLEANIGFNKDREYRVQIVQNNGKRDIVLAKGKVKLIDTGREAPEEEGEGEGEGEGDDDDDDDDDDDGDDDDDDDDDDSDAAGGEAPPPIDDSPAKKKGCTVTDGGPLDLGVSGLAILLLAASYRRRRANAQR